MDALIDRSCLPLAMWHPWPLLLSSRANHCYCPRTILTLQTLSKFKHFHYYSCRHQNRTSPIGSQNVNVPGGGCRSWMPLRPQKPHCFKLSTPLTAATQLAKYTFGSRTRKRSGLGEGSCEPTPYRRFPLELTSMSPPGILCTPPARYHNNSI